MRIRNTSMYVAVLGVLATLAIGGCTAAASAGSSTGTTVSAGSVAPSASVGLSASSPVSAPAPVASDTIGTAATILSGPATAGTTTSAPGTAGTMPSAPGTAGSVALPPIATAAPVTSAAGEVATPLPSCTPATLKTRTAGKLVFTSAGSVSAPWYDSDPADGKGYEAAVAAAVAKELGYPTSAVSWIVTTRSTVLAGTATGFDVAVGEFLTPDQTGGPVDYSTGYFSVSNSVLARAGSKAAAVATRAGLKSFRVGGIAGGSALSAARSQISPTATSYPTVAAALAALAQGSIDVLALPTSTAVAVGSAYSVVGQLGDGAEQPQQFGLVLAKGSPLTSCVSAAVDQLRVTGTLGSLLQKWIPSAARPLA